MASVVADLRRTKQLLVFGEPIRAELEIAAVLRFVYEQGGPAVLFPRVRDCKFPVVGNLYGSPERARFLLRHGLGRVEKAMRLKADPGGILRQPWRYLDLPFGLEAQGRPERTPAICQLAGRRGAFCHLAGGLQRGSSSAGLDAQQFGHVSGAAGR